MSPWARVLWVLCLSVLATTPIDLGSYMKQIALFVIPYVFLTFMTCSRYHFHSFMITLGWILGKPLTLLFDPFESVILFLSGQDSSLSARKPTLILFLCSFDCQLRCPRWKSELAQGHDSHVYVYCRSSISLMLLRRVVADMHVL